MSAAEGGVFPAFDAQAGSNSTLRPAIDAVNRVTEQAIFDVSPAGFTTRAVDAENVALVKMDLPATNFERFSADTGRFAVDVGELSDALHDVDKADPVRLEANPADEELLVYDVRSDGVIATLELLAPDDVRQQPDIPDLEWSAAVDVPADQFGRVVRATDDVSDIMAIGIAKRGDGGRQSAELALQTHAKGDVDEVIGYPEFEYVAEGRPADPVGALYSVAKVDNLRLGIDRAASTDLRLTFAGVEFPIKMEFTIGDGAGADVLYVLSPRIGSDSRPIEALEQWPVDGPALDTVDFVADMKGGKAKDLFSLFTTFADEYRLLATGDGMEMRAVDETNAALYAVEAQPRFFDSYQPVAGFPDGPVGLGDRTISDVLTKWRKNDDLEFAVDSERRYASLKHPVFTVRDALIDPGAIRQEPTLPAIDVSGFAKTSAETFVEVASGIVDQADVTGVLMSDGRFYLGALREEDPVAEQVPSDAVEGRALSVFSSHFIDIATDEIPVDEGNEVEVRGGLDFPVSILTDIDEGLLQSLSIIAPRIQEEGELADRMREAVADEPVNLAWVDDRDAGPDQFDLLADFPEETIEERFRQERLATFPIESKVVLSSLDRELSVRDAEDMAVTESTVEEVLETVEDAIRFDVLDGGEAVADVTFTAADAFELDYRNVQPDFEFRTATDDGVRMNRLVDEPDNYAYVSEQAFTPARQTVVIRAAADPDGDDFVVFAGLKERTETADPDAARVIEDGFLTIGNAYGAALDLIRESSIEELVQLAGGAVTLSDNDVRDALEEIVEPFVDYRLEAKPGHTSTTTIFYAAIVGRQNILPDAAYRADISVIKPGEEADGYNVRYSVSLEAVGPGDARIEDVIAEATVGSTLDRAEIPSLVQEAFEQIADLGDVFVRRERRPAPPRSPTAGPGVREGQVSEWTAFYLPASRSEIRNQVQLAGLPIELEDVEGVGPTRAETLQEAGIQDMLDLVALTGTKKSTYIGQKLLDIPTKPRTNLVSAAQQIWEQVIWPARETSEQFGGEAAAVPAAPEPEVAVEDVEEEPDEDDVDAVDEADVVTVISPFRPLTRGARDALQPFDILEERSIREAGRQTEVDVAERPPDEVLEEHELIVDEDPLEVWETESGERIEIFETAVIAEGVETTLSPEEAAERVRQEDRFSRVDVPEDSPFGPAEPPEDVDVSPEPVPTDGTIELPIRAVKTAANFRYRVPRGEVGLDAMRDINERVEAELGPAAQIEAQVGEVETDIEFGGPTGPLVGTAVVTDESRGADRDLQQVIVGDDVGELEAPPEPDEAEVVEEPADVDEPEAEVEAEEEPPAISDEHRAFIDRLAEQFGLELRPGESVQFKDLPGIGRETQEAIEEATGLSAVWNAQSAFEMRDERDAFDTILDLLPDDEARRTLVEAIGENPEEVLGLGQFTDEGAVGAGDTRDIVVNRIAGSLNYTVAGEVPGNVVTAAITTAIDELGDASQFSLDTVVGEVTFIGATVTEIDLQRGRDVLAGDTEVSDAGPGRELSAGQLETIIEQATEGVDADAIVFDDSITRVQLEPDFDSPVIDPGASSSRVNVDSDDPDFDRVIGLAIDQWERMTVDLPDAQKREINRRREALNEQFGLRLPLIDVADIEGMSAEAVEDVVTRSIAGAEVNVRINRQANSLRIAIEPVQEGIIRYSRDPQEVQGTADDPESAIIEALQEWESAVDVRTINVDRVNDRRETVELEFDMELPPVGAVGEPGEEVPERAKILEKWLTVKEGFALTDIDEDELIEQPGLDLPVEVEQEVAQMIEESTRAEFEAGELTAQGEVGEVIQTQRAMEGVRQVEQGLQIHYTEDVADDVHRIVAETLDVEPENLYDGSKPSDLEGYDLFRAFTLSRSSDDQPWSVPRFDPSALFSKLEPIDSNRIKVVALAAPLK